MIHQHHIVPKHMGGSDDPSNMMPCSIADHARYHKALFERFGNEWDRIAWLSLSGQIKVSEARRLVQREAFKRGGDIARANRNANGTSIGDWNRKTGHCKTIATAESMKKGGAKVGKMLVESGRFASIRLLGSHHGGKASNALLQSRRFKCDECGVISTAGGIGNHQRGTKHQGRSEVCRPS